jgi:hypothetical protein
MTQAHRPGSWPPPVARPAARRAAAWSRWALTSLGSAGVLATTAILWGGYGELLGAPVAVALQTLPVLLLVLGVVFGLTSLSAVPLPDQRARLRLLGAGVLVSGAGLVAVLLVPVIGLLGGPLAVGALIVAIGAAGERADPHPQSVSGRLALALPFTVITWFLVVAGVLQIVLWNPLAKIPGLTLPEIHRAMAAADESSSSAMPLAWAVFWVAVAVSLPILCAVPNLRRFLPARRIIVLGLVLVGAAASCHWVASFGMGMSLADAFGTSGGDAAPGGAIIALVGQAALVAALFLGLAPRREPSGIRELDAARFP